MIGDARLVGRGEELEVVRAALGRGGCVIAGPAGVGKSRLAAEASTENGNIVLHAVATAAAGAMPFGAVGHLLSRELRPRAVSVPAFMEMLHEQHPDGELTLLVDDAHLLDDSSAVLLLAIATTHAARLLVTVRTPERAPDAIVALWKEHRLDRVDLQPLARPDVRVLVDDLLESPAHALVYDHIFELTQGNPLYVTEVVADARRTGALAKRDGRWHWQSHHLRFGRLRDLVGLRTHAVSADGRRALELLAVGAPLPLHHVHQLAGPAVIEELERSGLVTVTDALGTVDVHFVHPLYAEVIAADTPQSVARRLRRELADVLALEEQGEAQRLQRARWLLDAGELDVELFVDASILALRRGDPFLAHRLAQAAGSGLEASLCCAAAQMELGRFAEVEQLLAPREADASALPIERAATYVRTRTQALHWGGANPNDALDLLDRVEHWIDTDDWRALQASMRGLILLDQGRPAMARAVVEPFASAAGVRARVKLDLLTVHALALSRLGLVDACEDLEPAIQDLVERIPGGPWETGWARFLVDGTARIDAARDLPSVARRLTAAHEDAQRRRDPGLNAAALVILGRLELVRGHVGDAITALSEAVDWLSLGDPRNAMGLALAYLARAHAIRRDVEHSTTVLERARSEARSRPHNLRLQTELARASAWLDAARGNVSRGRDVLLDVARRAGEDVTAESEVRYGAVRLGADPRPNAARLAALADGSQNDLLVACAAHVRALADHNADAQLDVAHTFIGLGADLFAAEAAARASREFRDAGHRVRAGDAAALARKQAARCGGVRTPALEAATELAALTAREHEVALLAARGLTNAGIARELTLSVRSVETYLLRVCRKLGVTSRRDLPGVVGEGDGT